MRMGLYAIRDTKAEQIGPVMMFRRDEPAIRQFADILASRDNTVGAHPEDHELVHLGFIDDESGAIEVARAEDGTLITPRPQRIVTGAALVATMKEANGNA